MQKGRHLALKKLLPSLLARLYSALVLSEGFYAMI